ncbi:MAG: creatininase family protein [Candidatus Natronoplasma sp.]
MTIEMKENVKIERMSWRELEGKIEDGKDTVVIVMGSFEQHGPHLPLYTDTYISDELGERIAKKLDYALMGPTIPFGVSQHHMDFSGTVSLSNENFIELVKEHCRAFDEHGFEFVALVPFHGGNFAPTKTAAPEIAEEMENAKIITVADLEKNTEVMLESFKKAGIDYEERPIHSGATETSIMLAIDEELVKRDGMEKGYEGEVKESALFTNGLRHFTENGVLGDPRKASMKAGKMMLKDLSDHLAKRVDEKRSALIEG